MSMCAFTSFLSKCLLPIYCFCLLLIVFSFLCFSIASSRCLCYLFKRSASPFRCTFLSCLLLISFQHKLAFPFFLLCKFFFLFPLFVRPALSIILTPHQLCSCSESFSFYFAEIPFYVLLVSSLSQSLYLYLYLHRPPLSSSHFFPAFLLLSQ